MLATTGQGAETLPALVDFEPSPASFGTVKKRLYHVVHKDQEATFYCSCLFSSEDSVVNLGTCGMADLTGTRALRVEAEHVVPASRIGAALGCWADGGRAGCLKNDPLFKKAHNDLHNLVPAVGAVNGARSNLGFGLIDGEARAYGQCDFEIDREDDAAEPAEAVRGDIARTYFYMEWRYGVILTEGQRRLFLQWHQQDPVDDWELERDKRIEGVQGNYNPFVR